MLAQLNMFYRRIDTEVQHPIAILCYKTLRNKGITFDDMRSCIHLSSGYFVNCEKIYCIIPKFVFNYVAGSILQTARVARMQDFLYEAEPRNNESCSQVI